MQIKKIYNEVVKTYLSNKYTPIRYNEDGEFVYITLDSFLAFKLRKNCFIFDLKHFICMDNNVLTNMFNDEKNKWFEATNKYNFDYKVRDKKIIKVAKIQSNENENIYTFLDTKFLKYFDNPTFRIMENKFNAIQICENNEIVGFVMPFRVDENKL